MNNIKVTKAIQFAMQKHAGQKRKASGMPYVVHLHGTALLMQAFKKSKNLTDLVCAAYLHDVLEDTDCTYEELEQEFGALVASLVKEVTNNKKAMKIAGSKADYLISKLKSCSSYALTLKLCDRLDNISSNPTRNTIEETIKIIASLINNRELSETQKHIMWRISTIIEQDYLQYQIKT